MEGTDAPRGLYILMCSVHGLVRGNDQELGRDPDTGGQVKYVVELARALSDHPGVERVDLLTRRIHAKNLDPIYAEPCEAIAEKARIIRLPCGPRRYLRKERLWPYLDSFVDQAMLHIRRVGRIPDVIHGHYADAGYIGVELTGLLGVPLLFTGHSLGRVKRARLLAKGQTDDALEKRYAISRRIEAEELTMDCARLVIASTRQEVDEQYAAYDRYVPERMEVIPPGVDLERFTPPGRRVHRSPIAAEIDRFLREPKKPLILAMARPDERKNLEGLVKAYAEHEALRAAANLAIIAGTRDDIRTMGKGARDVLARLLFLFDYHDLYGSVAYPKHHGADAVPDIYRLAASRRGVFVNPALTEPFGLTLLEAAASGLPVVATEDGGPQNIIGSCRNGILVDPFDSEAIGRAIFEIISDRKLWKRFSRNGIQGAHEHFSWKSHARRYVSELRNLPKGERPDHQVLIPHRSRVPMLDRILVTDIDNVLSGNQGACRAFVSRLADAGGTIGLAIVTGRSRDSALRKLEELGVPRPDILIARVGTEIHYGPHMVLDRIWERQIDYRWEPERVRDVMAGLPGIIPQASEQQSRFKISYDVDTKKAPGLRQIVRRLRQASLAVSPVFSHGAFLDLLPVRVTPGSAIRHIAFKWEIPPERMLVVGFSGNDEKMLRGNTLGIVVANHSRELRRLRGHPRIYFAAGEYGWGVLEGIDYYDFFGAIRIPESDEESVPPDRTGEAENENADLIPMP